MLFTLRRGEPLATGLSSAVTECVDDKYAVRYFGNTNCTDLIEGAAVDSLIENYRNAELATAGRGFVTFISTYGVALDARRASRTGNARHICESIWTETVSSPTTKRHRSI
jgi:hypothetical protein